MINFPGDSTIPGFPSIDAFLSLLNPLLKRLQNPAYEVNNKIHEILETEAMDVINDVMCTKYPEFNSRFKDLIRKILDKYRRNLESYLNSLLDSELFYLFTNDINYLVGDFHKVADSTRDKAPKNPLVHELRKRIDAYYKLVVRNLRDLIPKQIFNFLIISCMKELEFEAFQFTSDVNKLKEWLNEVTYYLFSLHKWEQEESNAWKLSRFLKNQKKESEWILTFQSSWEEPTNNRNTYFLTY